MRTAFTDLLDLRLPVVQAPMAGVSTAELAGAVSTAGGLGSIAVGAMTAEAADQAIGAAFAATSGPVNVNVFVHPRPRRDTARETAWIQRLTPYFAEFDAEPPERLREIYPTLDDAPELLDVLLTRRPPVISLHFGLPQPATLRALRGTGAYLIASATSVAEARQLEAAGIDVIVAQGYEAGGHRGAFATTADDRLPTSTLLPRVVDAVNVPVLAAGGVRDGQGIATAMTHGAAGAQLGTAFIECPESAAGSEYRAALRAPDMTTVMTSLFSGRPARGIVNRFVRAMGEWESPQRAGAPSGMPDYPVAYDAGKQLAAAAAAAASFEFTAMWAGAGPLRSQPLPALRLLNVLGAELEQTLASSQ